mmetsp:Transcript_31227/g.65995  ORF Transcript_31227/g.65995 Transcript_31227/m.65995 type:complete len:228 (+) Transcript_31227:1834-2517(+)
MLNDIFVRDFSRNKSSGNLENLQGAIVTLGRRIELSSAAVDLPHVEHERGFHDGTDFVTLHVVFRRIHGTGTHCPELGSFDGLDIREGVHPLVEIHTLVNVRCASHSRSELIDLLVVLLLLQLRSIAHRIDRGVRGRRAHFRLIGRARRRLRRRGRSSDDVALPLPPLLQRQSLDQLPPPSLRFAKSVQGGIVFSGAIKPHGGLVESRDALRGPGEFLHATGRLAGR